jgi:hypothetical protein
MVPVSREQHEEFADYPEDDYPPRILGRKKKTDNKHNNKRGIQCLNICLVDWKGISTTLQTNQTKAETLNYLRERLILVLVPGTSVYLFQGLDWDVQ